MRRGWILTAILALAAGAGALVLGDVLSLEALAANRDALTAWRDTHYLGAVLALLGLIFQSLLSVASGSLGQWLLASSGRQQFLERLMGLVFLGLAARLLMMERRG